MSVEFSLGSFGTLCKISDVKIVKLLLPPPPLMESINRKHGNQVGIEAITCFGDPPNT